MSQFLEFLRYGIKVGMQGGLIEYMENLEYRICGNFRGIPIFAVFRGQYGTAKIKIAKYFPISVKNRRQRRRPFLQLSPAVSLCFVKFQLFSVFPISLLLTGTSRGKTNNDRLIGRE